MDRGRDDVRDRLRFSRSRRPLDYEVSSLPCFLYRQCLGTIGVKHVDGSRCINFLVDRLVVFGDRWRGIEALPMTEERGHEWVGKQTSAFGPSGRGQVAPHQ